jgi:hypothetical protein
MDLRTFITTPSSAVARFHERGVDKPTSRRSPAPALFQAAAMGGAHQNVRKVIGARRIWL